MKRIYVAKFTYVGKMATAWVFEEMCALNAFMRGWIKHKQEIIFRHFF